MAVTSSLFYFFIAITACTLACGLYVVAEKLWGNRAGVKIKNPWSIRREGYLKAGKGTDEEVNVRQEGPSVV